MTRTINEWEAQRLLRIADLCEHECMIALPPSEAAQSAAQRRAAQLTALSQLEMTSKELGMALCISDYSARRLCRLAIALATRLSSTRTHLSHGDLDRARADIINEYADPLAEHHYDQAQAQKKSPEHAEQAARNICQALEALILPKACKMTPAQLRRALRRAVMRLDPEFADAQTKETSKTRGVWYKTNEDGTGELHVTMGAAEIMAMFNTLDGYARTARKEGSSRSINALRADVMYNLIVNTFGGDGHVPTPEEMAAATAKASRQSTPDDAIIVPDVDPNTGDLYPDLAPEPDPEPAPDLENTRETNVLAGQPTHETTPEPAPGSGRRSEPASHTGDHDSSTSPNADSDGSAPESDRPEDSTPESTCHGSSASKSERSDGSATRSAGHGSSVPEIDRPEDSTAETTGHGSSVPEIDRPGGSSPRSADRDGSTVETTGHGSSVPEIDRPEGSSPRSADHQGSTVEATGDGGGASESERLESETSGPDLPEGSAFSSPGRTTGTPENGNPCPGHPHTCGSPGTPRTGPSACGVHAHVQVVVTLDTLLGVSEEPGDLIGHGPITANTARDLALASGSTWSRLVVDPMSGYLLDYGRTKYRPPVALADHVRARDFTCRTPNCDRPAAKSDLDHIIPWPAGATSEDNLGCACDRDHRFKHEGKWTHRMSTDPNHPERTLILTSPTGQVYISYPHSYLEQPIKKPVVKDHSEGPSTAVPVGKKESSDPPF